MDIVPLKPQILARADATVTRIIPELAVEIGLNQSILLLQLAFWIHSSNNLRDGDWWTYQSLRDMRTKAFPYWSHPTIQRGIKSLLGMKLIKVGNFNTRPGDDTQWYALDVEGLQKLESIQVELIDSRFKMKHPVSKRNTLFQIETPPEFEVLQNETTLPDDIQRVSSETTQRESTLSGKPDSAGVAISSNAENKTLTPTPVQEIKPIPSIEQSQEPIKIQEAAKPKIDLWEYAMLKVWPGGTKYWRNVLNMLSGRSKKGQWAEYNFEEEMRPQSPAVILAFKKFMETEEEYETLSIPQKPESIYRYWGFFRNSKRFDNLVRICETQLAAVQELHTASGPITPIVGTPPTATSTPIDLQGLTKENFSLERVAEILRPSLNGNDFLKRKAAGQ